MANVWGYWKCPACGGLVRGDKRNCPGCEAPIPKGVKYMPPNHPEVVKAFEKNGGNALEYVPSEQERNRPNWICKYCGAQNYDEVQACVGCGMPRFGANEDYFGNSVVMSEEEKKNRELSGMGTPKVEKAETERDAGMSEATGGSDAGMSKATGGSDAGMSEATGITSGESAQVDSENMTRSAGAASTAQSSMRAPGNIPITTPPRKGGRWKWILLAVFLFWCVLPVKKNLTVEGFEWQREIAVEEYQLCHESDWSLPSGAKLTKKKNEIHHYNKVLDHYETKTKKVAHRVQDGYSTSYKDLGNGQFKEVQTPRYRTEYTTETYKEPVYKNVPVYQTKYYYDIGRWKGITPIVAHGMNKEAYWPETSLPTGVSNPSYGDRRQGSRKETYWVILKNKKGKTEKHEYSQGEWNAMNLGDTVSRKKARFLTWFD